MTSSHKPHESRAVFDVAITYEAASVALGKCAYGAAVENLRLIGPMCALSAFSIELYLKCLLVDLGSTVPNRHHLHDLFSALPRQIKAMIEKRYRLHPQQLDLAEHLISSGYKPEDCTLDAVLKAGGDGFVFWRYYFEDPKARMSLNNFATFMLILRVFIIQRHPDWERDGDQYFRSTFPIL